MLLTERFTQSGEQPAQTLRQATLPVPLTQIVDRRPRRPWWVICCAIRAVRLVTLIGAGGIGKTRLAIEVARKWAAAPPGGTGSAWFVDLAPVRDPALWVGALAGALGIRPEGSGSLLEPVIDRLQGRPALIMLDNFEQVLAAAAELGRFLAACPELTVLVTSRSALQLRGEHEVPLEPARRARGWR